MLWTDGEFVTAVDLMRVDSEVLSVAEAESITLEGSNSLLRGAIEETSNELMKLMVGFGGYIGYGDVSANHLAAVLNVGLGSTISHKAHLSQVVVSGPTPDTWNHIKQWVVFWSLHVFYRDAFNRTVKDRYEGKMRFFKSELQRRVTRTIDGLGIPLVMRPLSRPAALFERDSGTWDSSNVTLANDAAGTINDEAYDVVVTYVDMSANNLYVSKELDGNAESHPSDRARIELLTGKVILVDISSLNPPTGVQHPSQRILHAVAPLKATHWNVYVGKANGVLKLQNASPIPISTTSYQLTGNPGTVGYSSGSGQYADRVMALNPTRQRS